MTQLPPVMPGYPTQPPQGDWSPPTPKKRGLLPWIVGAAVVLVLAVGGLAAVLSSGGGKPAAGTTTPPLPQDRCGGGLCPAEVVATATTPTAIYTPNISEFVLTAKITSKQCFGSAGCSIEFEPELDYSGYTLDEDVTWRLIYEATGVEDGPLIGTVEVTGLRYESESEVVDTKSTKSKIKLRITSIEKLGS